MAKLCEIRACRECRHYVDEYTEGPCVWYCCYNVVDPRRIEDDEKIPNWCPLPDVTTPLRWTSEPPKVAGWYWYRNEHVAPSPVEVYRSGYGCEGLRDKRGEIPHRYECGNEEWLGPIPEPEEQ